MLPMQAPREREALERWRQGNIAKPQLGLLAALAGAYFPSRRAAATDPARTLAG